jgi:hypothetical protein
MEGYWDGKPIPRPGPAPNVRRGVEFAYSFVGQAIRLRRTRDGRVRWIAAADGVLTNAGLFYAHNRGERSFPGGIVFIPFDELFKA